MTIFGIFLCRFLTKTPKILSEHFTNEFEFKSGDFGGRFLVIFGSIFVLKNDPIFEPPFLSTLAGPFSVGFQFKSGDFGPVGTGKIVILAIFGFGISDSPKYLPKIRAFVLETKLKISDFSENRQNHDFTGPYRWF